MKSEQFPQIQVKESNKEEASEFSRERKATQEPVKDDEFKSVFSKTRNTLEEIPPVTKSQPSVKKFSKDSIDQIAPIQIEALKRKEVEVEGRKRNSTFDVRPRQGSKGIQDTINFLKESKNLHSLRKVPDDSKNSIQANQESMRKIERLPIQMIQPSKNKKESAQES